MDKFCKKNTPFKDSQRSADSKVKGYRKAEQIIEAVGGIPSAGWAEAADEARVGRLIPTTA